MPTFAQLREKFSHLNDYSDRELTEFEFTRRGGDPSWLAATHPEDRLRVDQQLNAIQKEMAGSRGVGGLVGDVGIGVAKFGTGLSKLMTGAAGYAVESSLTVPKVIGAVSRGESFTKAVGDAFSDSVQAIYTNPLSQKVRRLEDTLEVGSSSARKANQAEFGITGRAAKLKAEAEGAGPVRQFLSQAAASGGAYMTSPELLVDLPGQIANMIPSVAAGRAAQAMGAGAKAITGAVVGTGAVMQGSDVAQETFERLKKSGASDEEASRLATAAGVAGGAVSAATMLVPGATLFERSLLKPAVDGAVKGSLVKAGVKGVIGGGVQEATEEGFGKFASNYAVRQVDPNQALDEGVADAVGQAFVTGGLLDGYGGVRGARAQNRAAYAAQGFPQGEIDIRAPSGVGKSGQTYDFIDDRYSDTPVAQAPAVETSAPVRNRRQMEIDTAPESAPLGVTPEGVAMPLSAILDPGVQQARAIQEQQGRAAVESAAQPGQTYDFIDDRYSDTPTDAEPMQAAPKPDTDTLALGYGRVTKDQLFRTLYQAEQVSGQKATTKMGEPMARGRSSVAMIMDAPNPVELMRELYDNGGSPRAPLLDAWHGKLTGLSIEDFNDRENGVDRRQPQGFQPFVGRSTAPVADEGVQSFVEEQTAPVQEDAGIGQMVAQEPVAPTQQAPDLELEAAIEQTTTASALPQTQARPAPRVVRAADEEARIARTNVVTVRTRLKDAWKRDLLPRDDLSQFDVASRAREPEVRERAMDRAIIVLVMADELAKRRNEPTTREALADLAGSVSKAMDDLLSRGQELGRAFGAQQRGSRGRDQNAPGKMLASGWALDIVRKGKGKGDRTYGLYPLESTNPEQLNALARVIDAVAEMGVPTEWFDKVNGVRVVNSRQHGKETQGVWDANTEQIGIRLGQADMVDIRGMAETLIHELMHQESSQRDNSGRVVKEANGRSVFRHAGEPDLAIGEGRSLYEAEGAVLAELADIAFGNESALDRVIDTGVKLTGLDGSVSAAQNLLQYPYKPHASDQNRPIEDDYTAAEIARIERQTPDFFASEALAQAVSLYYSRPGLLEAAAPSVVAFIERNGYGRTGTQSDARGADMGNARGGETSARPMDTTRNGSVGRQYGRTGASVVSEAQTVRQAPALDTRASAASRGAGAAVPADVSGTRSVLGEQTLSADGAARAANGADGNGAQGGQTNSDGAGTYAVQRQVGRLPGVSESAGQGGDGRAISNAGNRGEELSGRAPANAERGALRWRETTDDNPVGLDYHALSFSLLAWEKLNLLDDFAQKASFLGHAAHSDLDAQGYKYIITDSQGANLGDMVVETKDGQIVAVHDITVKTKNTGLGAQLVGTLAANLPAGQDLRIIQIVPTAAKFWNRVGAGALDVYNNATISWGSYSRMAARQATDAGGISQTNREDSSSRPTSDRTRAQSYQRGAPTQARERNGNSDAADPRTPAGIAYETADQTWSALADDAVEQTRGVTGMQRGFEKALGWLTLEQIAERFGAALPAIKPYAKAVLDRAAASYKAANRADQLIKDWDALPRPDAKLLAEVMLMATNSGFHPEPGRNVTDYVTNPTVSEVAEFLKLRAMYDRLPSKAKTIYAQAKQQLEDQSAQTRTAFEKFINDTVADPDTRKMWLERVRTEFAKLKGPYFPLARFGDYILTVRGAAKDGRDIVMFFESEKQREQGVRELVERDRINPNTHLFEPSKKTVYDPKARMPSGFMKDIHTLIDQHTDAEASKLLHDAVQELFTKSLPELSGAKAYIRRRNVEGFDTDAKRAFANAMAKGGRYAARLNYAADVDAAIEAAANQSEGVQKRRASLVIGRKDGQTEIKLVPPGTARLEEVRKLARAGFSVDTVSLDAASFKEQINATGLTDEEKATQTKVAQTLLNHQNSGVSNMTHAKVLYNHILKLQQGHIASDNENTIVQGLGDLGYVWYLGITPSFWVLNLLQNPMVYLPHVGAKYGFTKASVELLKTAKWFANTRIDAALNNTEAFSINTLRGMVARKEVSGISKGELDMLQSLEDRGALDFTQAADLSRVAHDSSNVRAKAMRLAGAGAHHTEVFNRVVAALTSYRLALKESGDTTHEAATELAAVDLGKTHFNYTAENKPLYMSAHSGSWTRLVFMFQQYRQHMLYWWANNIDRAANNPEERAEALKAMGAMTAMGGVFAGAMGLPFMGAVQGLATLVAGVAADPGDEPFDFERWLRKSVVDMTGSTAAAQAVSGGALRAVGIDISQRVGQADLLPFTRVGSANSEKNYDDKTRAYFSEMLGPIGSIGLGVARATEWFTKGQWLEGLQATTPKGVADMLRAYELATAGMRSGATTVLDAEKTSGASIAAQALGFRPASVSETMSARAAVRSTEKSYIDAKSAVQGGFVESVLRQDREGIDRAVKEIQAYNQRIKQGNAKLNEQLYVNGETLEAALRARLQTELIRQLSAGTADSKKQLLIAAQVNELYNTEPGEALKRVQAAQKAVR